MFRFFKKDRLTRIAECLDVLTGPYERAQERRSKAVETLISKRKDEGFHKMTQAVFVDGYDLIDFETTKEKYVGYFKDKTHLKEDEICILLRDIYDAGVENKRTNERVGAFHKSLYGND